MLFIEYDVHPDGAIEVVALIEAIEENDGDPDGEVWLTWRRQMEDGGHGCAPVSEAARDRMEDLDSRDELLAVVEEIILEDRRTKEAAR